MIIIIIIIMIIIMIIMIIMIIIIIIMIIIISSYNVIINFLLNDLEDPRKGSHNNSYQF